MTALAGALAAVAGMRMRVRVAPLPRFLRRGFGYFEDGGREERNSAAQHPLDVAKQAGLVARNQGNRLAERARPTGAADAVHIVLGHVGQLVVDHVRQFLDVETAGGDLGGDQRGHLTALEHDRAP